MVATSAPRIGKPAASAAQHEDRDRGEYTVESIQPEIGGGRIDVVVVVGHRAPDGGADDARPRRGASCSVTVPRGRALPTRHSARTPPLRGWPAPPRAGGTSPASGRVSVARCSTSRCGASAYTTQNTIRNGKRQDRKRQTRAPARAPARWSATTQTISTHPHSGVGPARLEEGGQ